jgi:hypothetical protein
VDDNSPAGLGTLALVTAAAWCLLRETSNVALLLAMQPEAQTPRDTTTGADASKPLTRGGGTASTPRRSALRTPGTPGSRCVQAMQKVANRNARVWHGAKESGP